MRLFYPNLLGLFLCIYPYFCLNLIHYKNISLLACIGFQAISKIILQNSLLFPFIAIPLYQQNKNNMTAETKIYSDFIKRNKVKVTSWGYTFRGEEVRVYKADESKWWYSEIQQDNCYTKKSAIYWCLKNRFETIKRSDTINNLINN